MSGLFGFLFGIWLIGAIPYSFYCWAKRTDKSQAPVIRRFTAMALGLTWPYVVFVMFRGRAAAQASAADHQEARNRIFGDSSTDLPQQASPVEPEARKPVNPFDR